jgi:hypothetical protein
MTLTYIAETILAPNCGAANCHSTWKHERGNIFDTVSGTQYTLARTLPPPNDALPPLIGCLASDNVTIIDPCDLDFGTFDARSTYLYQVLVDRDTEGDRMPLDQPLANKDIAFIAQWIDAGAPGYVSLVNPQ